MEINNQVSVVPAPGIEVDDDLKEDCELLTKLIRRHLSENPGVNADEAFLQVRLSVGKVSVLSWDRMCLARIYRP